MKTGTKILLVVIIAAVLGTLARMQWPEDKSSQPEKKSSVTTCQAVDCQ